MTIKATGEDTGGVYTLLDQLAPPGFGPPLHVHHLEDEPFFVLEGLVRFRCGDREFLVENGGYVYLPKRVPHAFRVEASAPAHLMQMTLPPGFERFVEEISVPAPSLTLPPPVPLTADLADRLSALGPKTVSPSSVRRFVPDDGSSSNHLRMRRRWFVARPRRRQFLQTSVPCFPAPAYSGSFTGCLMASATVGSCFASASVGAPAIEETTATGAQGRSRDAG